MFGNKPAPQPPSIVSQDAAEMLPGARSALAHIREAMREYPALYRTNEYHALQQVAMEMLADLETLASGQGAHHA